MLLGSVDLDLYYGDALLRLRFGHENSIKNHNLLCLRG